jgi:hypothetical protein
MTPEPLIYARAPFIQPVPFSSQLSYTERGARLRNQQ